MLGDNDYRFSTPLGLIIYYICTVFVQIAMLNIVISVVSDIYDRVQMSKKEVDLQTKAELLHDYAEFMLIVKKICCGCKRKTNEEIGFLYVLEVKKNENQEDDWSGKINATNDLIKETQTIVSDKINEIKGNCTKKVDNLNKSIKKIED